MCIRDRPDGMTRKLVVLQRIQVGFHRSVVDAQELVGGPAFFSLNKNCGGTFATRQMYDEYKLVDRKNGYAIWIGNCLLYTSIMI